MAIDPPCKLLFSEVVKQKNLSNTQITSEIADFLGSSFPGKDSDDLISLSTEDKQRFYSPWRFSIIINLIGKKFHYQYLKKKLIDLWKLKELFSLIDLGHEFYTVKLMEGDSQKRILQEGPWFVSRAYLSFRLQDSNFITHKLQIKSTAIWIRLSQLSTEYYDNSILHRVGRNIVTLLNIDACTSATIRGRYTRIYIQVPP